MRHISGRTFRHQRVCLKGAGRVKLTFEDNFGSYFEGVRDDSLIDHWQTLFSVEDGEAQDAPFRVLLHRARGDLTLYPHIFAIACASLSGEFTDRIVIGGRTLQAHEN